MRRLQGVLHSRLEASLAAMAMVGAVTLAPITPNDIKLWAVSLVGALAGGLICSRAFPARDTATEWQWAISTLTSMVFSPFLFDWLTTPGTVVADHIPSAFASINGLLALSAALGIFAWGTLKVGHAAWLKWIERKAGELP